MKNQQPDTSRRSLLKAVTLGSAAGAAIAATGSAVAATPTQATKAKQHGYQETDHVKAYYQSLRG
ncbi:formate dehydrogenase [Paraferrimonas haliotis]|uniref:Fnr-inducible formate dehydrogenase accessory protein FdhX n=1 Tax=Paraferrimonas haliotis TaxID=2013866 RepID=A0AA37WVA5_9GAMM|nr:formate dehydrogenase [Paraferrimonas haliotis]GLS82143.1 Fnr-inducible formate dehydrogenase accessory protein FdhX [Paraferrimonas haliotis]